MSDDKSKLLEMQLQSQVNLNKIKHKRNKNSEPNLKKQTKIVTQQQQSDSDADSEGSNYYESDSKEEKSDNKTNIGEGGTDDWDPDLKGTTVSIAGKTVEDMTKGYQSVYLKSEISTGCYYWRFKIIHYKIVSNWSLVFGISKADECSERLETYFRGYGLICYNNNTYYRQDPNNYGSATGTQFGKIPSVKADDIFDIFLNFEKDEMLVYKNGVKIGNVVPETIDKSDNCKYRLGVILGGNLKVELLRFNNTKISDYESKLKKEFNIVDATLSFKDDPPNNTILLDGWNTDLKGTKIKVDGLEVTNNGYNSIFGKKVFNSGEHHWKFRIIHMTGGSMNWNHVIGISLDSDCKEKVNTYYKGYGFVPTQAKLMSGSSYGHYGKAYGVKLKTGDIIDMYVNFNTKKMWYSLNNIDYGIAYHNIREGKYRIALTLNSMGERFKLLEYQERDSSSWNIDNWHPYLKSSSISIHHNLIKNTSSKYNSCFGERLIFKGKHHWKFRIVNCNNKNMNWNFVFGLCSNDRCSTFIDKKYQGYGFIGSIGKLIRDTSYGKYANDYGTKIKTGDIIDMNVDFINGRTISYSINDKSYGIAYKNIRKDTKYKLAVTLCTDSGNNKSYDRIELLDYEFDDGKPKKKDDEKDEEDEKDEKKEEEEEEEEEEEVVTASIDEIILYSSSVKEGWNSKLKGDKIQILSDNVITNTGYNSVFGNKILSSGKHHWKFKIEHWGGLGGNWNHVIGISAVEDCEEKRNTYYKGYGFVSVKGKVMHDSLYGNYGKDYGTVIKSGDTVDMYVDFDAKTIKYSINDVDQGIAYENIRDGEYRLAVCLNSTNEKLKLVSYEGSLTDEWNPNLKGDKMTILTDGKITNTGYNTCFGKSLVYKDRHHWKFKITKRTGNSLNWNHVIGISLDSDCEEKKNTYYKGYGFVSSKGKLMHGVKYGHYGDDYARPSNEGDEIDMYIDFNENKMWYVLNGDKQDIAYEDIRPGKYRLACCLNSTGEEIQLISHDYDILKPKPDTDVVLYSSAVDEGWNSKLKGDKITILDKVITNQGYNSVFGNKLVSIGKHHWKFKVEHWGGLGGNWNHVIGISENEDCEEKKDTYYKGYGFVSVKGKLMHGDKYGHYGDDYASPIKSGDTIDMYVDFDDRTIRYSVNDVDKGVAYTSIRIGEYRLACTLNSTNEKLRLVSYTGSPSDEWNPNLKGDSINILTDGKITNTGYNTCFGKRIVYKDRHHWKFKITKKTGNSLNWNHVIGISLDSDCEEKKNTYYKGYGFVTSQGKLMHETNYGHYGPPYARICNQGDEIDMYVDFNEYKIWYLINGEKQEIAYEGFRPGKYRLACCLNSTGEEIQLISHDFTILKQKPKIITKPISGEAWNSELKGDKMRILDNHVLTNSGYNTCFGTRLFNSGKHHWRFKIIKWTGNSGNWNHVIGISLDSDCNEKRNTYYKGYGFVTVKGKLMNGELYGHYGKDYGKPIKSGDFVDMYLDLDAHTMSFSVNDNDYGMAYDDIRDGDYRLAVCLNSTGEKIQLITYDRGESDSWDDSIKGSGIKIFKSGVVTNTKYNSVFGRRVVTKHKHHWKLKIVNSTGEKANWNHVIGLSLNNDCENKKETFFNGYGFVGSQGKLMDSDRYGNYGKNYGSVLKTGDIVDMFLDFNTSKLWYHINGVDQGIAYENVKDGEYRLAVCLNNTGEKVKLISHEFTIVDRWDNKVKGSNITISNTQLVTTRYDTIFSANIISKGKHHWKFECGDVKSTSSASNYLFGLCLDKFAESYTDSVYKGYGFIASQGKLLNGKSYGSKIKKNDIVDMYVDFSTKRISYSINNKSLGDAYTNLLAGRYRMGVSLHDGANFKLLEYDGGLGFSDGWNNNLCGGKMTINKNMVTNSGYCSCFGKALVSSGVHHWKFRIKYWSGKSSNWNHVVGISLDKDCDEKKDTYFKGYGFVSSQGKLINADRYGHYGKVYGKPLKTGDTIDMTVNFTTKKISFKLNDRDYGVAYENVRAGKYRLACTLNSTGEQLELLEYTSETDKWNPDLKGDKITISGNMISNKGYNSVFGTKIVSTGRHHWQFKIIHWTGKSSNWNHVLGISLDSDCKDKRNTYYKGYGWVTVQGKVMSGDLYGNYGKNYGEVIKSGDTVDMYVDFDTKQISYSLNGKNLGIAYKDIRPGDYRLAVTLNASDEKLELVKYETLEDFDWDTTLKGRKLTIYDNRITNTTYDSAFGTRIVGSGKHNWKVQCVNTNSSDNSWNNVIGLCLDSDCSLYYKSKFNGYGFIGSSGKLVDNKKYGLSKEVNYGSVIKNGDIIDMHVDFNNNIIWYDINGKPCGIAYTDLKEGRYRLALTVNSSTERFKLLDYNYQTEKDQLIIDGFSQDLKGDNMMLFNNEITNEDKGSIFGNAVISSGEHHYKFEIINYSGNKPNWNIVIGISNVKDCESQKDGKFKGYGLIGSQGKIIDPDTKNSAGSDYGDVLKSGDIVEMVIDFDNNSLWFIINKQTLGVAYKNNIEKAEYRLAVTLNSKNETIKLLSYENNSTDSWNKDLIGEKMTILENNEITNTGYNSCFGRRLIYKGRHHWKCRILHWTGGSGNWNHVIGISLDGDCDEKKNTYFKGYGFVSSQGKLMNADMYGHYGKDYGTVLKSGDIIDMYLDLDEKKMWFNLNNNKYGIAYDNIKPGKYRLALTLNSSGELFKILDYEYSNDEYWNEHLKGKSISINENIVTNTAQDTNSCFGKRVVSSGKHHWKLQSINFKGVIGIILDYNCPLFKDKAFEGYGFDAFKGSLLNQASIKNKNVIKNGDIIDLYVDFNDKKMFFCINGLKYSSTYNIELGDYRLACTLNNNNESIKFLSYQEISGEFEGWNNKLLANNIKIHENEVINLYNNFSTCFGNKILSKGLHHWEFQVINPSGKMGNNLLGLCLDDNSEKYLNNSFKGYFVRLQDGKLKDNRDYGVEVKPGDLIDMYVSFNITAIWFKVNGAYFGYAYTEKEIVKYEKYRMACSLFGKNERIKLVSYEELEEKRNEYVNTMIDFLYNLKQTQCEKGHKMQLGRRDNWCDNCRIYNTNAASFICRICDFDLCPTCLLDVNLDKKTINYYDLSLYMKSLGSKKLELFWKNNVPKICTDRDSNCISIETKFLSRLLGTLTLQFINESKIIKGNQMDNINIDSLEYYINDACKYIISKLPGKEFSKLLFISKDFQKLLMDYEWKTTEFSDIVVSKNGNEMEKYLYNKTKLQLVKYKCSICGRELNMNSNNHPQYFYICRKDGTALCPGHSLGSYRQTPKFLEEATKFCMGLINSFNSIKSGDKLEKIWNHKINGESLKSIKKNKIDQNNNVQDIDELTQLCRTINNLGNGTLTDEEIIYHCTNISYQLLISGSIQDIMSRRSIMIRDNNNNPFIKVLLRYYWEFDESKYKVNKYNDYFKLKDDDIISLVKYFDYYLNHIKKIDIKTFTDNVKLHKENKNTPDSENYFDDFLLWLYDTPFILSLVNDSKLWKEFKTTIINGNDWKSKLSVVSVSSRNAGFGIKIRFKLFQRLDKLDSEISHSQIVENKLSKIQQEVLQNSIDYHKIEEKKQSIDEIVNERKTEVDIVVDSNSPSKIETIDNVYRKEKFENTKIASLKINWIQLSNFIRNCSSKFLSLLLRKLFSNTIENWDNLHETELNDNDLVRLMIHFIRLFLSKTEANYILNITETNINDNLSRELEDFIQYLKKGIKDRFIIESEITKSQQQCLELKKQEEEEKKNEQNTRKIRASVISKTPEPTDDFKYEPTDDFKYEPSPNKIDEEKDDIKSDEKKDDDEEDGGGGGQDDTANVVLEEYELNKIQSVMDKFNKIGNMPESRLKEYLFKYVVQNGILKDHTDKKTNRTYYNCFRANDAINAMNETKRNDMKHKAIIQILLSKQMIIDVKDPNKKVFDCPNDLYYLSDKLNDIKERQLTLWNLIYKHEIENILLDYQYFKNKEKDKEEDNAGGLEMNSKNFMIPNFEDTVDIVVPGSSENDKRYYYRLLDVNKTYYYFYINNMYNEFTISLNSHPDNELLTISLRKNDVPKVFIDDVELADTRTRSLTNKDNLFSIDEWYVICLIKQSKEFSICKISTNNKLHEMKNCIIGDAVDNIHWIGFSSKINDSSVSGVNISQDSIKSWLDWVQLCNTRNFSRKKIKPTKATTIRKTFLIDNIDIDRELTSSYHPDRILDAVINTFESLHPKVQYVPSLSRGCELAIEIQSYYPVFSALIKENILADPMLSQIFSDKVIVIPQTTYQKLQINARVLDYLDSNYIVDKEHEEYSLKFRPINENDNKSYNKCLLDLYNKKCKRENTKYSYQELDDNKCVVTSSKALDNDILSRLLDHLFDDYNYKDLKSNRSNSLMSLSTLDEFGDDGDDFSNSADNITTIEAHKSLSFESIVKINQELILRLLCIRNKYNQTLKQKLDEKKLLEEEKKKQEEEKEKNNTGPNTSSGPNTGGGGNEPTIEQDKEDDSDETLSIEITSLKDKIQEIELVLDDLYKFPIWPYIEIKHVQTSGEQRKFDKVSNGLKYLQDGGSTLLDSKIAIPVMGDNNVKENNYKRYIYYEVNIIDVGINKTICVGASLGKDFAQFTSGSSPGNRQYSWGLRGDSGKLLDSGECSIQYGAQFTNNMTVGCGFLIQKNMNEDEAKQNTLLSQTKYDAKIFYTYNGVKSELYPSDESLLPPELLHNLYPKISTGSKNCILSFNFGPKFKYYKTKDFIFNSFKEVETIFNKHFIESVSTDNVSNVDNKIQKEEKDDEKKLEEDVIESKENYALLNSYEANDIYTIINLIEGNEKDFINDKEKYSSLSKQFLIHYYFEFSGVFVEGASIHELRYLLVLYKLFRLSTRLYDANITGREFLNETRNIQEQKDFWAKHVNVKVTNDDINLLNEFREAIRSLLKRYSNITSSDINIGDLPSCLKLLTRDSNNTFAQAELYNIYSIISHDRKTTNVEENDTSDNPLNELAKKQTLLLNYISLYLSFQNTTDITDKLIYKLKSGEDQADRLNSHFSIIDELKILFNGFIRGATNPISAGLIVARFAKETSEVQQEIEDELLQLSKYCENQAVEVLNTIHSKRLSLIALDCNKSIDIALESELTDFISAPKVQLLRQLLWDNTSHEVLTDIQSEKFNGDDSELVTWYHAITDDWFKVPSAMGHPIKNISFLYDFLFTSKFQHSWYFSPLGQVQLETLIYILYLVIIFFVASLHANPNKINVYAPLLNDKSLLAEDLFWGFNFTVLIYEINQYREDAEKYFSDSTNYVDFVISFSYSVLFLVRCIGHFAFSPEYKTGEFTVTNDETGETTVKYDHDADLLNDSLSIIYSICWFVLIMFICMRLSVLLYVFKTMGLMVKSLLQMFVDVGNLAIFVIIFLMGFALVFVVTSGGEVEGFTSLDDSILTMFNGGILGDFETGFLSYSKENTLNPGRSVLMQSFYSMWLTFSVIILLNFIIAVMSKSYEDVNDEVERDIAYYRMKVTRSRDSELPTAPAPLNVVVSLIKMIYFFIFEPLLYIFTGTIVDEEWFLSCNFDKSSKSSKWRRIPYVIQYSSNMFIKKNSSDKIYKRMLCSHFSKIFKEMWYGGLQNGTDTPYERIWSCTYCGTFNEDHEHTSEKSCVLKYYEFNNKKFPPEFGFTDSDITWLQSINPQLCNFCRRYKNPAARHEIIESALSFWVFFCISYVFTRLFFTIILLTIFAIIGFIPAIFMIIFLIYYGICLGFYKLFKCFEDGNCCKCCCCTCSDKCGSCVQCTLKYVCCWCYGIFTFIKEDKIKELINNPDNLSDQLTYNLTIEVENVLSQLEKNEFKWFRECVWIHYNHNLKKGETDEDINYEYCDNQRKSRNNTTQNNNTDDFGPVDPDTIIDEGEVSIISNSEDNETNNNDNNDSDNSGKTNKDFVGSSRKISLYEGDYHKCVDLTTSINTVQEWPYFKSGILPKFATKIVPSDNISFASLVTKDNEQDDEEFKTIQQTRKQFQL